MLKSTLIYLEKAGKYLMLHRVRKKNDVNHDKWIGVGGRFEPGETAEVCARREVTEETGYVMGCINYRGIVTFISDTAPHEELGYSRDPSAAAQKLLSLLLLLMRERLVVPFADHMLFLFILPFFAVLTMRCRRCGC